MAPQGHPAHLAKLSLELLDLAEELQVFQATVGLGHEVVKFFLQLTIQPLSQLHTGPEGWEERGHQCQVLPGKLKDARGGGEQFSCSALDPSPAGTWTPAGANGWQGPQDGKAPSISAAQPHGEKGAGESSGLAECMD